MKSNFFAYSYNKVFVCIVVVFLIISNIYNQPKKFSMDALSNNFSIIGKQVNNTFEIEIYDHSRYIIIKYDSNNDLTSFYYNERILFDKYEKTFEVNYIAPDKDNSYNNLSSLNNSEIILSKNSKKDNRNILTKQERLDVGYIQGMNILCYQFYEDDIETGNTCGLMDHYRLLALRKELNNNILGFDISYKELSEIVIKKYRYIN